MAARVSTLVTAIAACALSAAVPVRARAQECGPDQLTAWWPRFVANAGGDTLTPADRAIVEARLRTVEALLRKSPYGTPRGFAVQPWFSYHQITSRTQLYPYGSALSTFLRCNKYDEHGQDIIIDFNPDPMAWSQSDRPMLDERGDGLYSEMVRTPTLFGATATFGTFHAENAQGLVVLFTTAGQSPTLPVTREEYLRAMIFTVEGKDGATVKAGAAIVSKTPYERWMADVPERKKRNEELLAIVAKSNPAQAATMRADMTRAEEAETAKLKKADAYEREQVSKNLAGLTAMGDKYRAQIAAMTPPQRASAALVQGLDLVPAGTANAYAIVRRNPAFYRASGSPLEPRAVVVKMSNTHKEYWAQQEQLYRQLDWAAIKKMVNP